MHLLHSAHVLNYVFRMPVSYLEHIRSSKLRGLTLCGWTAVVRKHFHFATIPSIVDHLGWKKFYRLNCYNGDNLLQSQAQIQCLYTGLYNPAPRNAVYIYKQTDLVQKTRSVVHLVCFCVYVLASFIFPILYHYCKTCHTIKATGNNCIFVLKK